MDMIEKWIENCKGNWVGVGFGCIHATVYAIDDGMWGAIWNGAADGRPRRLKEKFDSAEDAQAAIEVAADEGEESERWWPSDDTWMKRKGGGFYRKVEGMIVSVKQARSKSWYAVCMGGALLGQHRRPVWFTTAEEACKAVDALDAGRGNWSWIGRQ